MGTKINKFLWLIIAGGVIIWSSTMVKSGLLYPFGLGFWGPNGHDGIWHIALAQSLARGSWEMPVFSGKIIQNYHIGYDLLLAMLEKITFIPVSNLYFQILPPVIALLIGLTVYKLVSSWKSSETAAVFAVFFTYFGGSFAWIITLIRNRTISGESMFWSQQAISTLINPPFALSLVVLFFALSILKKGIDDNSAPRLFLASFLFGILIQIKVYAGLLAIGGLFIAGIWQMVMRRGITVMKVFTGALIIAILLFSTTDATPESTIIFKPFWFLETMMSDMDRLYWPKFAEALSNYRLAGNFPKEAAALSAAFFIFLIGNLGSRIIVLPYIIKKFSQISKTDYLDIFFFSVIGAGIFIPLLFIQRGTAWNTIQFFYYSLVFSGVLAGIMAADYLQRLSRQGLRYFFAILVVIVTIPTTIGTLPNYLPARPPSRIPNDEIAALNFLRDQPGGVILVQPFNRKISQSLNAEPARPLYLYESTAYVSAMTNKTVFLEDEVNLEITGYPWKERKSGLQEFFAGINPIDFLHDNNISYLYLLKGREELPQGITADMIFDNQTVRIYKI